MSSRADAPWSPDPDAEEGLKRRLGENIRLLRARTFISQEELASRADIHRTQISLIESGRQQPLIGTTLRFAAALEVDVATLLDGIAYRPRFFSAARGEFEISPRPLFDIGGSVDRSGGMTVVEQIGLNLKKIRRNACMSQDDLSRLSGLHHTEISLLERGGRVPRLDTCIRIIESTGGDPRDLFEGIAWHESARWDKKGWFTIAGLDGPVDVSPPRNGSGA